MIGVPSKHPGDIAFRSKLFVPGNRIALFEKAARSAADALSFDLEDAVAADQKAEARSAVSTFLAQRGHVSGKLLIVRVNGYGTAFFEADVDAVVSAGVPVINLPAVDDASMLRAASAAIRDAERRHDRSPTPLLVNIETPRGLRHAADIAADPAIIGLNTGYGDLFEPYGIDRHDPAALGHVRVATRLAAAEAGVAVWDGAFGTVSDPDGFRAECLAVRALGFAGKTCIHPSQIAIANDVFSPDPAKVSWARRVVAAAETAEAEGRGAVLLEGRMIDLPFVAGARALLAAADRFGQPEGGTDA